MPVTVALNDDVDGRIVARSIVGLVGVDHGSVVVSVVAAVDMAMAAVASMVAVG